MKNKKTINVPYYGINEVNKMQTINKRKFLVIIAIALFFVTTILTGASENTTFYGIGTNVDRISFTVLELVDDTQTTTENVRIEYGEHHFEELLQIISKYEYQQVESGPKYRGRNGLTSEGDDIKYIILFKTYDGLLKKDDIAFADNGILTVNKYNYSMSNAHILVDELVHYSINNDLF